MGVSLDFRWVHSEERERCGASGHVSTGPPHGVGVNNGVKRGSEGAVGARDLQLLSLSLCYSCLYPLLFLLIMFWCKALWCKEF